MSKIEGEMGISEEVNPEEERGMPYIVVNMDKATKDDYKELEGLGWTKGNVSTAGEVDYDWRGEGKPVLPDEMKDRIVIGDVRFLEDQKSKEE